MASFSPRPCLAYDGFMSSPLSSAPLYPPIAPHQSGHLDLDGRHKMYWEVSGNPAGVPVVFLHGGPGSGASPDHRRYFDPAHYRIIIFDQRGAGRSLPLGELTDNTTPHLIADMERLREHLGVTRWLVFGGSWGSTLAIAYGQHHPDRCIGLVLRGIFLCRQWEIDWFLYEMRTIFPEAWRKFESYLPEDERGDLLHNYHRRLIDPDPAVHMPAARAWSTYEGACSTLLPSPDTVNEFGKDVMALGLARIEAHYFVNDIFLPKNALLENAAKLAPIPAVIVQGRYDVVCPIRTADELVRAWPHSNTWGAHGGLEYVVVPDAGHAATEPGIRRALVAATEKFKIFRA